MLTKGNQKLKVSKIIGVDPSKELNTIAKKRADSKDLDIEMANESENIQ